MNIKIYVKPKKVIGIVVKNEKNNILGMIHSRWNDDLNSYEIKRVCSKQHGLAFKMYRKLFSIMKNSKFTNDREACSEKTVSIWNSFLRNKEISVVEVSSEGLTVMDCSNTHYHLGNDEYLSYLDVDWFRSITLFRVLYSYHIRKIIPSQEPFPLVLVNTGREEGLGIDYLLTKDNVL